MAIQNKENLNKIILMFTAILSFFYVDSYATTPEKVLLESYKKKFTKNNLEDFVKVKSELEFVLNECEDEYLASRIQYQIGVLNFNIEDYKTAYGIFDKVAKTAADKDVLISALNMKAYSARFSGKTKEAINCFKELLQKIEKQDNLKRKLIVSSYLSLAQLKSQIGDTAGAIEIYSTFLTKYKKMESMNEYLKEAIKAKLRLLFESGDIDGCMTISKWVSESNLPKDFKGTLELQRICMNFLSKQKKIKGLISIEKIPVYTVSAISEDSSCDSSILLKQISNLSKRYNESNCSIYINYFQAWLFDASGNKREALGSFKKVIKKSSKLKVENEFYHIGEYAKVQAAIISGELKDYNSALTIIDNVNKENSMHLLQISESVKTSLATLKREVPSNEKN